MTQQAVVQAFRDALLQAMWLGLPVLVVGFLAGILISLVQILTSIQDTAFTTVPRLAAFLVALIIFMPWMLTRVVSYAASILGNLAAYAR